MASNPVPLPMSLTRARGLVGLQIALSVPFQLLFVWIGTHLVAWSLPGDALAERLAFALRWELLGVGTLLGMIGMIAGARPLWGETIGGDPLAKQLETHVRVQRNTLEQLMLMFASHLALATSLSREDLGLLPTLATLFVVARIIYWVGYVRNPMLRTFGFVATFYPNIYAVGLALWYGFAR
jgi:uncharacterized MAPEG superfamily protein